MNTVSSTERRRLSKPLLPQPRRETWPLSVVKLDRLRESMIPGWLAARLRDGQPGAEPPLP